MLVTLDCPEFDCWQALFGDSLSPEEQRRYEHHLESCEACQKRLDRAGEFDDIMRGRALRVGDPTAALADPVLTQVLDRLYAIKSPLRSAEDADLFFLGPGDRPELLGMLGNYEVEDVIGQGGMGVVLKAYEPALHRHVAIKVLSPALAGSDTARRRFTREAQAVAAISHAHVVPVHGVYEEAGLPYLVMQYIAGESLQDRLDRGGPLTIEEVLRVGLQTAQGLAAAHAQGLVHRDVKPANILLSSSRDPVGVPDGTDGTDESYPSPPSPPSHKVVVKITDFGLARLIDDVGLTQNGVVVGTPEYMAPEQARGEVIDHRADLFSLGSVLYACCTGQPPFRGSTTLAVLRQVSDEDPAPIRSLNPDVPGWLEEIISRLLAKDPATRFGSAGEVAALLEGCLSRLREPAMVAPPKQSLTAANQGDSAPKLGVRSRMSLWLTALVSVAALGLGIASWFAGAGDVTEPNKAYKDNYSLSLKGAPENSDRFELFGPDVEKCIRYEPSGLRLTLPLGFPDERPGTGLTIPVTAKGDFEITVDFEILQEPQPADAGSHQTLFAVDAVLNAPGNTVATISRKVGPRVGSQFLAWMTVWDEAEQTDRRRDKATPTKIKAGRFRMVRTGTMLAYYVADAADGMFTRFAQLPFAVEDLQAVRLVGSTGGPRASLDVRVTHLTIRSENLVGLPSGRVSSVQSATGSSSLSPGNGWLMATGIVALVILLSAVVGLIVRRNFHSKKTMVIFAIFAVMAGSIAFVRHYSFVAAGDATVSRKTSVQEYYRQFHGKPDDLKAFEFEGPEAQERVTNEPSGLRITLPAGYPDIWLALVSTVKGDFEITIGFEILVEPEPTQVGRHGTRLTLGVLLDTEERKDGSVSRRRAPHGETQFFTYLSMPGGMVPKLPAKMHFFPTETKTGRLRLIRTGSVLSCQAAEGADGAFSLLKEYPFSAIDLKQVYIGLSSGSSSAPLEVRITDFRLRAEALPGLSASDSLPWLQRNGWLVVAGLVGLVILLSLAVSLIVWAVRRAKKMPVHEIGRESSGTNVSASPAPLLSVRCPGCGKKLKGKADFAGKKVKCPQCGEPVLVPVPAQGCPRARFLGFKAWLVTIFAFVLIPLILLVVWLRFPGKSEGPSFLDETLGYRSVPGVEDSGFYHDEVRGKSGPYRWTNGHAKLIVPLDRQDQPRALWLLLHRPKNTWLQVMVNGRELVNEKATKKEAYWWERTLDLTAVELKDSLFLEIISNPIKPFEGDSRHLGVKVRGIELLRQREGETNSKMLASFVDVPLGGQFIRGLKEAGFSEQEEHAGDPCRWTNGAGRITVPLRGKKPHTLQLTAYIPSQPNYRLGVTINGTRIFDDRVPMNRVWSCALPLSGVDLGDEARIELESSTFVPSKVNPNGKDDRELGIRLIRLVLMLDSAAEKKDSVLVPRPDEKSRMPR